MKKSTEREGESRYNFDNNNNNKNVLEEKKWKDKMENGFLLNYILLTALSKDHSVFFSTQLLIVFEDFLFEKRNFKF